MGAFDGRRVLVAGLGASGFAAAEALIAEGATVVISERGDRPEDSRLERLGADGVAFAFGGHERAHLEGVDLAVVSPGIPEHALIIRWLTEQGIPIWSEPELGARLTDAPMIAITGTNGKSTTTEMVAACLGAAGSDAVACGNIGVPFTSAAREEHDAYAVEVSSFQLRFTEAFHPRVSVLLNIAEDHLDWHGDMASYASAKAQIFAQQANGDTHVGNRDDATAAAVSATAPCRQVWFGMGLPIEPGDTGFDAEELVVAEAGGARVSLGVPRGSHEGFRADAAAAAAACLAFGLTVDVIRAGLATVEPGAHRGEVVATVGGVSFIDDSKATNPHAALVALQGRTDVVLIAGGRSKGVDLTPLRDGADSLRAVVAIGESAQQIEDLFSGIRPVHQAESLEHAVAHAFELVQVGDTVLLAPGCASQDMFIDYRERGDRFAAAAKALVAKAMGGARG